MTWKMLQHQNVLPLLGVSMQDYQFAMASEWMENGNINEFTKANRDVNRFKLVGHYFLPSPNPSIGVDGHIRKTAGLWCDDHALSN